MAQAIRWNFAARPGQGGPVAVPAGTDTEPDDFVVTSADGADERREDVGSHRYETAKDVNYWLDRAGDGVMAYSVWDQFGAAVAPHLKFLPVRYRLAKPVPLKLGLAGNFAAASMMTAWEQAAAADDADAAATGGLGLLDRWAFRARAVKDALLTRRGLFNVGVAGMGALADTVNYFVPGPTTCYRTANPSVPR